MGVQVVSGNFEREGASQMDEGPAMRMACAGGGQVCS